MLEEKEEKEMELMERAKPKTPLTPEMERPEKIRFTNLEDDLGFVEVVSSVPLGVPTHPLKRIKFYVSGTTYRIYFFDTANNVWRYASLI